MSYPIKLENDLVQNYKVELRCFLVMNHHFHFICCLESLDGLQNSQEPDLFQM